MEYIYVLQLEDDRFYVGKTTDVGRRFIQHMSGEGAKWTQIYKPVSIVETRESKHELDEEMATLEWMDKKSVEMVRGDCFTSIRLTEEERMFITKKLNTMKNQCYLCNQQGHFANKCPRNEQYKGEIQPMSICDLRRARKFTWLIKGLIPEGSLVCMYGIPGCGKTFMALDIGLHIANGVMWNECKTASGLVFYINAEGLNGLYNRIRAWQGYHEMPMENARFFVIEMYKHCLHKRKFSEEFIKMVRSKEQEHGCGTKLIVVDTFAHALSGLEENSSSDVSLLLKEMLYINAELEASTMFVHHSNKAYHQIRGSSAILAAVDTSIQLKREHNHVELSVMKQKDGGLTNMRFIMEKTDKSCVMVRE